MGVSTRNDNVETEEIRRKKTCKKQIHVKVSVNQSATVLIL